MKKIEKIQSFSPLGNNLLALLVLLLVSLFVIPIIGYLDEGNYKKFNGVLDYAFNSLPMEDLLILTLFFVSVGLLVFNLLATNASLKKDVLLRLIVAIFIVPVGIPAFLMAYAMMKGM